MLSFCKKQANFCLVAFFLLGFFLFHYGNFLLERVDLVALENYYYASQWFTPGSRVIMSDNELYQWAGYQIFKGVPLFSINPEVPPLGKYFYGASIFLTGNPYWPSLFLFVLSVLVFYFWAKIFLQNQAKAKWATLFLAFSPLFYGEIARSMLDLPQLFFFLAHVLFLHLSLNPCLAGRQASPILRRGKFRVEMTFVLSALALGYFAACKIALYLPLILLTDFYFLAKNKKYWQIIFLPILVILAYASTYLAFFLQEKSLMLWLGNQKWMWEFYRISLVKPIYGMAAITLFTGFFKGWWAGGWILVKEYNLLWPLSLLAVIWGLIKKKIKFSYEVSLFLGLLAVNLLIPFWPRYLLLLLPLGILLLVKVWGEKKYFNYALMSMLLLQFFYLQLSS